MTEPFPPRKTSGLAVASLVMGILGFSCLGLLTGLPAIICGHVARGRIREAAGRIEGAGIALAGLILGYASILSTLVIVSIVAALAVPAFGAAAARGKATQQLNHAKQIDLAIQQMALDSTTTGNKSIGYPADAGITSVSQLRDLLVQNRYLSEEDAERLHFEDFLFGNVSASDPGDTIVIRSHPEADRPTLQIVMCKNGDGNVIRRNQPIIGTDPPREPAYLAP